LPKGWPASKTLPAPADPGDFPPAERLHVLTLASGTTEDRGQSDTRWSLDNLAFDILRDAHHRDMSRSTIARILNEADLKPHRSQYWLNSHDPDFDTKAADICQLYLDAPRLFEEGRLVLCSDEKTGMQILERKYPTKSARPGQIEKREFEYIRHGTRALLATFCVPTGQVVWNLGPTRTSVDWVGHLEHVAAEFPQMKRFDWVVDNLNTHWSLDVCKWVADRSGIPHDAQALPTGVQRRKFLGDPSHKHVFHFTPIHGSWLNQVELFFSVLSRRFLKRGDFPSAQLFEERIEAWLTAYNRDHAHPYRWTYTGEPLVRATPFSQTRRQQRRGRAGFGNRPLWMRRLYPPRPYRRKSEVLATNL
jgi:DDE superfamily endonuclease